MGLVNGYLGIAIRDRNWKQAEALVAALAREMPDSPGSRDAVVGSSLTLILARDGWKAAEVYFLRMLPQMTDAGSARYLRIEMNEIPKG